MSLSLQSGLAQLTEIQRAVRDRLHEGGSLVPVLAVLALIAAAVYGAYYLTRRQRARDTKAARADPCRLYHDLLGIPISARSEDWSMIFFTLGQHHDFAVSALGNDAAGPDDMQVGLDHVAFKLDGGLEALREAKALLEGKGIEVASIDHVVSKSLYFKDPDGNGVELYIDGTEAWREDPSLILSEGGRLDL